MKTAAEVLAERFHELACEQLGSLGCRLELTPGWPQPWSGIQRTQQKLMIAVCDKILDATLSSNMRLLSVLKLIEHWEQADAWYANVLNPEQSKRELLMALTTLGVSPQEIEKARRLRHGK